MKKDILYDLTNWSIKTGKSAGADDCRVGVKKERAVIISYRDRKPQNIREASSNRIYIELFVNKRYSKLSSSDLGKEFLKEFISNGIYMAKLLAEDPFRTLPDPKYYRGRAEIDLEQYDASYEKRTVNERHQFIKAVEAACLEKGGDKVVSVEVEGVEVQTEELKMTSNGFEGQTKSTLFIVRPMMTVQDINDRRPNVHNLIVVRKKKDMPSPETIAKVITEQAYSLLGAKKIKTESLPVIIENRNCSRLLDGLVSAMSGSNIERKQSFLVDKKNKKIGSRHLTIIDDPFVIGGLGSRLFDNDGIASKKRTMIESGILRNFYVDWYFSQKLAREPTTGGPSNLIIPPGKRSIEEIMKDLGRGIIIKGLFGSTYNSLTGSFSSAITGQLFENGQIAHGIREMNISGDHLELWNKLVEVANDPRRYSSQRTPSLVFSDLLVSGL